MSVPVESSDVEVGKYVPCGWMGEATAFTCGWMREATKSTPQRMGRK